MTDVAHLIQDLRAEAHRAPADCAELMRSAAAELEAMTGDAVLVRIRAANAIVALVDAHPSPPPFPPPALGGKHRRPATVE